MAIYVLRRLILLVPLWIGISFFAFGLAAFTPGDPARTLLERQLSRRPTSEEVEQVRHELGLDDPFLIRYIHWLQDAASGDLGKSYNTGEGVLDILMRLFPATLQLAALGLLISLLIALPLGVLAAVWQNSVVDHLSRVLALLGGSMPSYWVAYLLMLVFAVNLHVLPVAGRGTWQHLVLPSVTLGLGASATLMRLTRSELLEVLGQDFIRTCRAKGLTERVVVVNHALRNALIPIITVAGLRFASLLGGAVIVETIFAWPGIGKFVVDSIFVRDYPAIQGFVIFMGSVFLLVNLIVDLSYAWLDPQIRHGAQ